MVGDDGIVDLPDRDGWLHTGDLGRIDAAGAVTVVDRLKELIGAGQGRHAGWSRLSESNRRPIHYE